MRLNGKVAIVTGAARGIGREIALTFAKEGANVAIADINVEGIGNVCREIKGLGKAAIDVKTDLSKSQEINELINTVVKKFGRIDILANVAAYIKYEMFLDFKENEWDRMMDIDLKAYFTLGQCAAKEMLKNRKGKIINIASIAGELGFVKGVAYCSAKAGVYGLTRVMAMELAQYGINVNAISPGPTDTGGIKEVVSEAGLVERLKRIPLGRFGAPADIAKAAVFLASEDSDWVTGHILKVDGGFSAVGMMS